MTTDELRQAVVEEARTWLGTPYHLKGMVKGAGVDCGLLPYAVYRKFDLVPEFDPAVFTDDWFCNTTQERYLMMVQRYLRKLMSGRARASLLPEPPPGAMVCARVCGSPLFNHSGIVTHWPFVVHAIRPRTAEVSVANHPMWALREIQVYDPFPAEGVDQ
jgi:cell wall-associated NlpC family hydrolase